MIRIMRRRLISNLRLELGRIRAEQDAFGFEQSGYDGYRIGDRRHRSAAVIDDWSAVRVRESASDVDRQRDAGARSGDHGQS